MLGCFGGGLAGRLVALGVGSASGGGMGAQNASGDALTAGVDSGTTTGRHGPLTGV